MTNRELDYWISCNVMEWREAISPMSAEYPCFIHWPGSHIEFCENMLDHSVFAPTAKPADAFTVLEKCAEKCPIGLEISRNESLWFISRPDQDSTESAMAETLPLAICQFAFVLFGGDTKKS